MYVCVNLRHHITIINIIVATLANAHQTFHENARAQITRSNTRKTPLFSNAVRTSHVFDYCRKRAQKRNPSSSMVIYRNSHNDNKLPANTRSEADTIRTIAYIHGASPPCIGVRAVIIWPRQTIATNNKFPGCGSVRNIRSQPHHVEREPRCMTNNLRTHAH